ncbi:hypothetical protein KRP22_011144 [Phytophthora ramorum]|nr:hypothetical protein KRP22_4981 [Phytophthora ramorum]
MKSKHTKLQEEHAELHHERNDMESEAWFWMMEKQDVQDEYKKLQDEHAQWKAACASLVKEVADLEAELERKLADAQQLAKEREQALTDKVAALESEVANLSSAMNQIRADFTKSHLASEETTNGLAKELAKAKAETEQHVDANKTEDGAANQREDGCDQLGSCHHQEEASGRGSDQDRQGADADAAALCPGAGGGVDRDCGEVGDAEAEWRDYGALQEHDKTAAVSVKLASRSVKSAAQTLQQPKDTKSAAKKESFGWASKIKRLAPSPSRISLSP